MSAGPFAAEVAFHLGPVPITRPVVTTWAIMAVLTGLALAGSRGRGGALGAALEIAVETIAAQVGEVIRVAPWRCVPLLGTLFLYLVAANLSGVVPGVESPTARPETPAALAAVVLVSVHYFGIRARGLADHLRRYTRPTPLLLPLNVLSELTRTFSLMVRLFGNMMSHELVLAIAVLLAGLLVPIPFMALGVLIGIIQAYIFTVLAAVFIGAATGGEEAG